MLDPRAGIFNNPAMTTLDQFNHLETAAARALISQCCASARWAARMTASRPYQSMQQFAETADAHWRAMTQRDVLEAFAGHPKIGALDTQADAQEGEHNDTRALAKEEQSAAAQASDRARASLARLNHEYEKQFGFIFIVCASGKSVEQMLDLLRSRLNNTREQEIANAAEEQRKITQLRIHKIFAL